MNGTYGMQGKAAPQGEISSIRSSPIILYIPFILPTLHCIRWRVTPSLLQPVGARADERIGVLVSARYCGVMRQRAVVLPLTVHSVEVSSSGV